MMHDTRNPWHKPGCRCDLCVSPPGPADGSPELGLGTICTLALLGAATAVPLAWAIDAVTTKVGLLAVFGL
jgi:hypothetical protein